VWYVSPFVDPKNAAQVASAVAEALRATKDPFHASMLAQGLSTVAARMRPKDAADVLAQAVENTREPGALCWLVEGLVAVSARLEAPVALALAVPAAEAPPYRLTLRQLVELLKMPIFIGEARRVVLDELGNRCGRRFADVWEFVRFARDQHLDLEFTSPPQRPEPAAVR
jgi:hypothetical protein